MPPKPTSCTSCGVAVDAYLCTDCLVALRVELTDAAGMIPDANGKNGHQPSLGSEVNVTRARRDQLAPAYQRWGASGTETPIPVKMHASVALACMHSVLNYWAGVVNRSPVNLTSTAAARVLLAYLPRLMANPSAGSAVIEITGAIHRARHAIDRPNDSRVYLGPCDNATCRRDVYSPPGSDLGRCVGCGAVYDVDSRRRWLLDIAQDRLGTAVEVAGLLRTAGVTVTPSMLRSYAHRGTLVSTVNNAKGHPMYRVGDALAEVLRADAARAKDQHVS